MSINLNVNLRQCARLCDMGSQIALAGVTGYFVFKMIKHCIFKDDLDLNEPFDKIIVKPAVGVVTGLGTAITLIGIGNCFEIASRMVGETPIPVQCPGCI